MAVGDLNGDGKPDLVVANMSPVAAALTVRSAYCWETETEHSRRQPTYGSGGAKPTPWRWGISTATAIPDLVVANVQSTVGVLLNISSFPTTTTITSSSNPSSFGQSVMFTATVTPRIEAILDRYRHFQRRRDDPRYFCAQRRHSDSLYSGANGGLAFHQCELQRRCQFQQQLSVTQPDSQSGKYDADARFQCQPLGIWSASDLHRHDYAAVQRPGFRHSDLHRWKHHAGQRCLER